MSENSQSVAKFKYCVDLVTTLLVMGTAGYWAQGWFVFRDRVSAMLVRGPVSEQHRFPIAIWLVVMAVVLILGVIGIHLRKHVAFQILCRASVIFSVWIVVWSMVKGCESTIREVDRFNFHQSQWTQTYQRQRMGRWPDIGSEYDYGYPGLLDQMWEGYRRARGIPGPAPPKMLQASAQLDTTQFQELGSKIDTLVAITEKANVPLRFFVNVQLGDGDHQPPEEVVRRVREILSEVDEELYLKQQ